jgi:hypothetical protein
MTSEKSFNVTSAVKSGVLTYSQVVDYLNVIGAARTSVIGLNLSSSILKRYVTSLLKEIENKELKNKSEIL